MKKTDEWRRFSAIVALAKHDHSLAILRYLAFLRSPAFIHSRSSTALVAVSALAAILSSPSVAFVLNIKGKTVHSTLHCTPYTIFIIFTIDTIHTIHRPALLHHSDPSHARDSVYLYIYFEPLLSQTTITNERSLLQHREVAAAAPHRCIEATDNRGSEETVRKTAMLFGNCCGVLLACIVAFFIQLYILLCLDFEKAMTVMDTQEFDLFSPISVDKVALSPYTYADNLVDEVNDLLSGKFLWNIKIGSDEGPELTVLSRPILGEWGAAKVPVSFCSVAMLALNRSDLLSLILSLSPSLPLSLSLSLSLSLPLSLPPR